MKTHANKMDIVTCCLAPCRRRRKSGMGKCFHSYSLLILLAFLLCCSFAYGGEYLSCPSVTKTQRPALLFIGGDIYHSDLKIALFGDGSNDVRTKHILSAKSMQISQLSNAVFLITTHDDARKGKVFAANLDKGEMRHIADSTAIHCLRSLPSKNMAVLLDVQPTKDKMAIYDLSLDTLQTTPRHTLSRQKYGKEYVGFGPRMKISPDLRYIAFVQPELPLSVRRWSTYTLKILDLSDGRVDDLVNNVGVLIGSFSSFALGIPPIEWLDDRELLYQDMDKPEKTEIFDHDQETTHRFKSVNVKTGLVRERMISQLPLSFDGGSLITDPLSGDLVFRDKWIIDLTNKSLKLSISPFAIRVSPEQKNTQILKGSEVLHSGSQRCVFKSVSASRANIAYSLRPWASNSLQTAVYAKTQAMREPAEITTGPYLPVRPVGWIE